MAKNSQTLSWRSHMINFQTAGNVSEVPVTSSTPTVYVPPDTLLWFHSRYLTQHQVSHRKPVVSKRLLVTQWPKLCTLKSRYAKVLDRSLHRSMCWTTEMPATCTVGGHCPTMQRFQNIPQLNRFKGKHLEGRLSMIHAALDQEDPQILAAGSKAGLGFWFIQLSGPESNKTEDISSSHWHELHVMNSWNAVMFLQDVVIEIKKTHQI